MPRINTYSDNASIENDDKLLTYDTQGTATKLTAFSTIWNWIVSKLHALTSSSAALTPSTDRVLMDKNGTMTRVEPAAVAKYGIETYNGSTIAGSAQTVKSALDTLNSKSFIPNPTKTNPATLNDTDMVGIYFTYDTCEGLPSDITGGNAHAICLGAVQLLIATWGSRKFYYRCYVNNSWTAWVSISHD